jgi:hypothetical protein
LPIGRVRIRDYLRPRPTQPLVINELLAVVPALGYGLISTCKHIVNVTNNW